MSEILNSNKNSGVNLLKVNEFTKEEYEDEMSRIKIELNEKIIENEKYQQEIHELRNKLKTCLATEKHLIQGNELMEENLTIQQIASQKKMIDLLEKFSIENKKYEEKISELQTSLCNEEEKNRDLRDTLNSKEKLFAKLKSENPEKTDENFILKEKIDSLLKDLEKKEITESQLLSKQQNLKEIISTLQKNYNEINDILQVKKADLESIKDILETTKDELFVCRSELESLKLAPASDLMKGNSLFAEVEDNRKKLINEMTILKKKYLHMKNTYDDKEQEIRALKAEKSALLIKLEDDTIITVNQSAKLIETYKSRIAELENKLKSEEKRLRNMEKEKQQPVENSFSYLQSLLRAKKKEVQDLLDKLEESSIQKILQEEMKYEIEKQLRQWRYKAMSYQAQLLAAENQTKCNDCLKMKLNKSADSNISINTEQQMDSELIGNTKSSFQEIDQSETTLEKLLQIPQVSTEKEKENIANHLITENLVKSEGNSASPKLDESVNMEETLPVSGLPVFQKPISLKKFSSEYKSDKENSASGSNANETIPKSTFSDSKEEPSSSNDKKKIKKVLRFTTDTTDPEKQKLTRQKIERKTYPVVFISSNSNQSEK